ncbi:Cytochrome b561 domain-containing protein, partial [Cucurbita argyrosperma subsp. argyrosperma]
MRNFHNLELVTMSLCNAFLLPLVQGSAHEGLKKARSQRSIEDGHEKANDKLIFSLESLIYLSHEKRSDIQLHGLLLWISMGFLMPVGILTIRMSGRLARGSTQLKVFFYLHVILQTLSLLLASAGAVMSLRKFENLFNNSHQRIGLALYVAIWAQAVIGTFRPQRSIGLWTVLFTAEICFIGFFYLFQDKWEFLQKQGVILEDSEGVSAPDEQQVEAQRQNPKDLLPDPCTKQNALRNFGKGLHLGDGVPNLIYKAL